VAVEIGLAVVGDKILRIEAVLVRPHGADKFARYAGRIVVGEEADVALRVASLEKRHPVKGEDDRTLPRKRVADHDEAVRALIFEFDPLRSAR
jgi:hypothetical protein